MQYYSYYTISISTAFVSISLTLLVHGQLLVNAFIIPSIPFLTKPQNKSKCTGGNCNRCILLPQFDIKLALNYYYFSQIRVSYRVSLFAGYIVNCFSCRALSYLLSVLSLCLRYMYVFSVLGVYGVCPRCIG